MAKKEKMKIMKNSQHYNNKKISVSNLKLALFKD